MKKMILLLFSLSAGMLMAGACAANTSLPPTQTAVPAPVTLVPPTPAVSCSAITAEPTAAPGIDSLFPPVSDADFSTGPRDAAVTIIEYCDFQAPGCNSMAAILAKLMKEQDDLRFVFRPFPLTGVMDKSDQAMLAALAADGQGKFWTMYELLFGRYNEWTNLKPEQFNAWAVREAVKAGLDGDQFTAALKDEKTAARMQSTLDAVKKLNLPAVPLVLINGSLQPSYLLDYQNVSDAVGLIALGKKQFTTCPAFNVDPARQYIATIHTQKGDIVLQLFPDKAPLAVNSFVFLARQGWYNGVTFHRVIPGFAAQAGDPSGTGKGNPGYFFNNETSDLKFDKPGMLAMANSGPDTNGSQFFITFAPASHLNGGYTIFGQVISGLEIAELLTPRDPSQGVSLPPGDKIISVEIEER